VGWFPLPVHPLTVSTMNEDASPSPQTPPASVSMAAAVADPGTAALFRGMNPAHQLGPESRDALSAPDLSSGFAPGLWWDDRNFDELDGQVEDTWEDGDQLSYGAWEETDSAGMELAGMSLPVFDVVVADADGGDGF
jgi:hypothetical protein